MTPFRAGLVAGLVTLVLDQASKLGLYFGTDLVLTQPWRLAPFADFVVVWNRGVSYGLLQQDGALGRWLLVALSVGASIALGFWMRRAGTRLLALSLGLIIGGAVGNAIDRIQYGYVVDFIDFSGTGVFPWVFNIADSAITVGVVLLIIDSVMSERKAAVGAAPEKA